jgi:hypothetical protein
MARRRAEDRLSNEMRQKMVDENLPEIEYSLADAKVLPEDYLNWVEHYTTHMPKIRNLHAHGTDMLYPTRASFIPRRRGFHQPMLRTAVGGYCRPVNIGRSRRRPLSTEAV